MPAKSKKQREAMAIALHHPSKLYKRNKGLLKMSKGQLHDFSITKEKGLPKKVKKLKNVPTKAKGIKKPKTPHEEINKFRWHQRKVGL